MSHDTEAAFASTEISSLIMNDTPTFFGKLGAKGSWSVYSGRESGRPIWPLPDAVIRAENSAVKKKINFALEFKRPNEGVHGILTALGQSVAYIEKGYDASIIVIPESYSSKADPGEHVKRMIETIAPDSPIIIYTYKAPDLTAVKPFHGKLTCVRSICLPDCVVASPSGKPSLGKPHTLWAHMREGMSYPDAFYKYCREVKLMSIPGLPTHRLRLTRNLWSAVTNIRKSTTTRIDVWRYLAHISGDSISDKAWQSYWFKYCFNEDILPIFSKKGKQYSVNRTKTKIMQSSTEYMELWSSRSDSIKTKLVKELNKGSITEDKAWEKYVKDVNSKAHSYKQTITKGLLHIGFLTPDGTLTDLGYKFVDACERIGDAETGIPFEILRASILQNGQYATLLHYMHKLSEEIFQDDFFAFSDANTIKKGALKFDQDQYLNHLHDIFSNEMNILRQSTQRAKGKSKTRKSFQAEMAVLKRYGFVRSAKTPFRAGLGLEIDWPQVHSSLLYFEKI